MPRAGARARTGNRPDVPLGATQPPTAATGQPYGHAGAQIASQQVVPLARQATPAPGGPGTPPGAPAAPDPAAVMAAFTNMSPPGAAAPLNAPTTRPGENITAGLGQVMPPATSPTVTLGQMLAQMASGPNSNPEVQFLAQFVQSGKL